MEQEFDVTYQVNRDGKWIDHSRTTVWARDKNTAEKKAVAAIPDHMLMTKLIVSEVRHA